MLSLSKHGISSCQIIVPLMLSLSKHDELPD